MKRRLFKLASAVSITMFVTTAVLWIYSALDVRTGYLLSISHGDAVLYTVELRECRLRFDREANGPESILDPWAMGYETTYRRGLEWVKGIAGFAFGHVDQGWTLWWSITPIWMWTILFALLPLWRFTSMFKRRRRALNSLCSECGYDLRATPGRCPECGAVPVLR